eukprot:CAMPEP_0184497178 /NCGR_PEP_ID=MMETSP0113_2-20130426/35882_1 /TAXON_ID=91329 /ORGANISM="Norrisiella sphaerica, Strain BC52" /LENGTH=236 /DNA_ID=CAMNT_0026884167 /DNA_START=151 /DNA_END=861 /DNA_ORIENTATION=-
MHQVLPESPVFEGKGKVFEDPSLPLYVDLGCGGGRFLLQLAVEHKGKANFMGVEIRKILADRANHWRTEFNVSNAYFVGGNINVPGAWEKIFNEYPGPISGVSVLMPDPWFKKRHAKRRILTPGLISTIVGFMEEGGGVYIQSDVRLVAEDMRAKLCQEPRLDDITNSLDSAIKIEAQGELNTNDENAMDLHDLRQSWLWLRENPTGFMTDREDYVMRQGGNVWRALFRKKKEMPS